MLVDELIQQSNNEVVRALVCALDMHQPGEGGHAERVSVYAVATGERLGLSDSDLLDLRRAAALHDVGKISISPELLGKLGRLSEEELDELRLHSMLAMKMVEGFDWLRPALPIVRHHHERWDGAGYPDRLAGEDIPLGARIVAVAEAFDALLSDSNWRESLDEQEALAEIRAHAGTQFDPAVVAAFLEIQPLIQPL